MFRVGMKVVRIRECDPPRMSPLYENLSLPVKGNIYTIREVYLEEFKGRSEKCEAILLVEIINTPREWLGGLREAGFCSAYFRPVVERKTDISIFQKLLTPTRVDA